MTILKRLGSLLLAAVMVLSMLPAQALATEAAAVPTEVATEPVEEETTGEPDMGINALSEAPVERGIETDEYGNLTFQTLADLVELASRSYDGYTSATYGGEGDLVIAQSLTIPQNLNVSAKNVTVAEGVTLTLGKDAGLYVVYLTVAGTLDVQAANVSVNMELNVTGSVVLNGQISAGSEIIGMENIQFVTEDSKIVRQVFAFSFENIKRIAEDAAQDTNPHMSYVLNIQKGDVTVTESVTLPANVPNVSIFGNLIIPSGVTMTVAGSIMLPPKFGSGGTICVQSGGTLECDALDAMNDCTVDGTLTVNTLAVYDECVFAANGMVQVNGEASVAKYGGKTTLDISGSMSCGSMVVDQAGGSVGLTGELKIKSFDSLEALGLDGSCYTATPGIDGFTRISPKAPSLLTEEQFCSALDSAKADGRGLDLRGRVVLTRDLEISLGDNVLIVRTGGELVVPSGVTLTLRSCAVLVDGKLTVEPGGKLICQDLNIDGGVLLMNGEMTKSGASFITSGGVMDIGGTLTSTGPTHVGHGTDATLNVNGTLMNLGYLNISGVVNVSGKLTNGEISGDYWPFVEMSGSMTITGTLHNDNVISLYPEAALRMENGGQYVGIGELQVNTDSEETARSVLSALDLTSFFCRIETGDYGPYCVFRKDETQPTIDSVKVTGVSTTGYTITCAVSDDSAIAKVYFETWTDSEGQENAVVKEITLDATAKDWEGSFTVEISDHGNTRDCDYHTTVRVVDGAGNEASYSGVETTAYIPTLFSSEKRLTMPAGLETIEASAFEGDMEIGEVVLPEGVKAIGSKAFADCASLVKIQIPDSVTEIAADAFENSSNVVLLCASNNAAAQLARENGWHYVTQQ